jgi:hypothetical protein
MADFAALDDSFPPGDPGIVMEASDRWKACKEWQGVEDERAREDIKFANGDSRNAWQWPTKTYADRSDGGNDLPCLTINNTRPHNDIIINTISKNGFGAKVRPVGGKASYKSAEIMQTLIDRIQYISKGSAQRRKVCEQQVDGGIGYMLIETAYVSNRTKDQDIYLKASRDPTGVYLDPWIREPDGLDANFGFVFDPMPRKEFNRKYPKWKNKVGTSPIDSAFADWISDKEIMLCKYYRKSQKKDTFVWYNQDGRDAVEKLASEIKEESGKEIYDALMQDIKDGIVEGGTRPVFDDQVEWFLIAGDQIIDRGDWAGKYIPICRCVGRELVIDKTLDRKGHTRPLIDAQRMLNYSASTDVQMNALQPKSPFIASSRATEGQEQWKNANINQYAVLLYNDIDDEAPVELQKIEAPQRLPPAQPNAAYQSAMQTAERQMMMISGQWQQQTGQRDNQLPESGKAIGQRKEQGDTATWHFTEHLSDMDRAVGMQLLDLIPKIYDTKRTLHIEGEDGEKSWVMIDPNQDEAVKELQQEKEVEEAAKIAFNPQHGQYECVSDPGPTYATQRQEAWEAMSIIMRSNNEIAGSCADLLFRYGDFPGSDKIAERLQKEIKATKPYLFDAAAEPQMMQLQQQNAKLMSINSELLVKLADKDLKIRGRDERHNIEAFDSDTKRMEAQIRMLINLTLTQQQKVQMEHELEVQGRQHIYDSIQQINDADLNAGPANGSGNGSSNMKGFDPSSIGARQAPDGNHYLPDPSRPGKYLMVQ